MNWMSFAHIVEQKQFQNRNVLAFNWERSFFDIELYVPIELDFSIRHLPGEREYSTALGIHGWQTTCANQQKWYPDWVSVRETIFMKEASLVAHFPNEFVRFRPVNAHSNLSEWVNGSILICPLVIASRKTKIKKNILLCCSIFSLMRARQRFATNASSWTIFIKSSCVLFLEVLTADKVNEQHIKWIPIFISFKSSDIHFNCCFRIAFVHQIVDCTHFFEFIFTHRWIRR